VRRDWNAPGLVMTIGERPITIPWTKLPFLFDPDLLRSDLTAIAANAWISHFNHADYAGDWSSVSLRSKSGRPEDILPTGSVSEFSDTPLMDICPHLREAVEVFQFPKKSIRLLRLHPGSYIKEHVDRDLGLADGELRIHVPIETNDRVEFIVANRLLPLREGESWYIDFSQPHRIRNDGKTPRTHLVIDGTLNNWAEEMLRRATQEIVTETFDPPGVMRLNQFREVVFDDPELRSELLKTTEPRAFTEAVVVAGAKRGFELTLTDVEAAYHQSRREWTLRSTEL
jgi:hypothetical protein